MITLLLRSLEMHKASAYPSAGSSERLLCSHVTLVRRSLDFPAFYCTFAKLKPGHRVPRRNEHAYATCLQLFSLPFLHSGV